MVLYGTIARAFALASQIVILLVMSWLLPKAEFGDAMIVFTLYRLLGLGFGTGLGNLLLYHVGRNAGDRETDIRMMRSLTVVGLAISLLVTALVLASAPQIVAWLQKPDMLPWLYHMSPAMLFGAMNFIMAGSFDGRSQITRSIVVTEVAPNALRLIGFLLIVLLSLPGLAIAHVLWIALALPWIWDLRRLFDSSVPGFAPLKIWDLRYAGWFTIYPIATQQLQGLDMLVVGWLFSSTAAADYSIASRIAVYYPFLQFILVRSFAPRAGELHGRSDIATLNRELVSIKRGSIIYVYGLAGLILLTAPLVLPLFGDYSTAMPILLLLSLPVVVRSIFAGAEAVLRMTGHASASTMLAITSGVLVVAGSVALSPYLSIYSLPVTMLLSSITFSPAMVWIISRSGIRVLQWRDVAWIVVPLLGVASAFVQPNIWVAAAISSTALLGTAFVRWAIKP